MPKDLTTSRLDRQNILNNEIAVEEIQEKSGVEGILWNKKLYFTREMTASFFEVDTKLLISCGKLQYIPLWPLAGYILN